MNQNKTCQTCGVELKHSKFARRTNEGQDFVSAQENLACRNYPECPRAEKETEGDMDFD